MFPLLGLGTAIGGIASLGKLLFGAKQNSLANEINPQWEQYQPSKYAQNELGVANQLFNSRMFGAADLEKNIYGAGANAQANIQRNATDSGQALAQGILTQGQSNDALQNLQTQEKQNKYNLLSNLNQAYQGMTNEGDKVYQSMLQKYQLDTEQQNQLRDSAWKNIFGGFGDLSSLGIQASQLFGNKSVQPYNQSNVFTQ